MGTESPDQIAYRIVHYSSGSGDICAAIEKAILDERERCASIIDCITMGDVLLACGELSAQERRTAKALLTWVANRVRTAK